MSYSGQINEHFNFLDLMDVGSHAKDLANVTKCNVCSLLLNMGEAPWLSGPVSAFGKGKLIKLNGMQTKERDKQILRHHAFPSGNHLINR